MESSSDDGAETATSLGALEPNPHDNVLGQRRTDLYARSDVCACAAVTVGYTLRGLAVQLTLPTPPDTDTRNSGEWSKNNDPQIGLA